LVTERRRDLAILKSLGTSSREVILLILSETVILSLVGALLGLAAFSPLLVLLLANSGAAWDLLMAEALETFGTVLAAALFIGLVFGVVPAWRAARETVTELLG